MREIVDIWNTIPVSLLTSILYLFSWIPFLPLIVANYGGLKGLPGQIGFAFVLHLPAFALGAAGFWLSPAMVLVPFLLVIAFDAFVIMDYFKWTGSTAALGLFVVPPGELVLIALGILAAYLIS